MNKRSDAMNIRERYEKNYPIMSVRLPVGTRDKLLAELQKRGTTLAEFLTAFANGQRPNLDS
jgi:hypothetical protein